MCIVDVKETPLKDLPWLGESELKRFRNFHTKASMINKIIKTDILETTEHPLLKKLKLATHNSRSLDKFEQSVTLHKLVEAVREHYLNKGL